jgi:hypothetical protein
MELSVLSSNPFSQFKPYKKHPTSEWPFFCHWLDDVLDLDTAPRQYFLAGCWSLGFFSFFRGRYFAHRLKQFKPQTAVDQRNLRNAVLEFNRGSMRWFSFALLATLGVAITSSQRRAEETDRGGDRLKELLRRSQLAGLPEEQSFYLAKDIVMRSDTREYGNILLDRALTNFVAEGVISPPEYTPDGVYIIPEHIRPKINGPVITPSGMILPTEQNSLKQSITLNFNNNHKNINQTPVNTNDV